MSTPASARTVVAFVRGRRQGWERLGALAEKAGRTRLPLAEVEELDRLYRRASADLALARSRFPGSDAEGYLSQLVASAYRALYRPRERAAALLALLRDGIPGAAQRHLGALALAVALFTAGILGGALAVAIDPQAAEVIVPEPVRRSVAAGQLWTGNLLSAAPGFTGAALLRNNVTVAAMAFGLGATAGLGTGLLLFLNGLLLGAVFTHVGQHALAAGLFGFVAAHGPLELSALLLAAQAGFVLAAALVDPGEWPRGVALQRAGREAAPLLAAVVPALTLAALLEAGVSPLPDFPGAAKALVGIGLGAALWAWLLGRGRGRRTRG